MSGTPNRITYSQRGDYLLPDLILEEQAEPETGEAAPELGMYGRMRRTYLREHREGYYNTLLLNGRLHSHLLEIDRTASERMERMMTDLEQRNPPPDKATDPMGWTAHMNSLRQQAQETVASELIYD